MDSALIQEAGITDQRDLFEMPPDRLASEGAVSDCVVVNGNEVVRQPKLSFSVSPAYRAPLGSTGWDWSTRLDWRRSGSNYLDDVNYMKMPDVDILNLSLTFQNDMFNVRLYANNITDEDTPVTISNGTDFNQAVNGSIENLLLIPRRPREIGVRAQISFGN